MDCLEQGNQLEENLFTVLDIGDRRIQSAFRQAILLFGRTRAGKSTVNNWMLRKPMIGKGDTFTEYVIVTEDDNTAKMSSEFVSCTLAPNVHVQYTEGVSLIDLAGVEDSRNYVGTIGVSYFLKTIYEKVREAKFIIVLDENELKNPNSTNIQSTFSAFFDMVNVEAMPDAMRKQLWKSIGFVIPRSVESTKHYEFLKTVCAKLKAARLSVKKKEFIIQIINTITDQARVEGFKNAVPGKEPEECDFPERWNDKLGWQFFDLEKAEKECGASLIRTNFSRQYGKLDQFEKQETQNAIKNRAKAQARIGQVVKTVHDTFFNTWNQYKNKIEKFQKVSKIQFDIKPIFAILSQYLKDNDLYDSAKIVDTKFRVSYTAMELPEVVETVSEMCKLLEKIGNQMEADFKLKMSIFEQDFQKLATLVNKFSSQAAEEQLVERFKYVLNRGFKEFSSLYDLDPQFVHEFQYGLADDIRQLFDIQEKTFLKSFIENISAEVLPKAFPTLDLLMGYEKILTYYQYNLAEDQNSEFFSSQRKSIDGAKAEIMSKEGQQLEALLFLCNVVKSIGDIYASYEQLEEDKTTEKQKLSMEKIKLVKRMVHILKNIGESKLQNSKNFALTLCKTHRLIDEACVTFESILSSMTSPTEKTTIFSDYINFCKDWGRIEDAYKLAQKWVSFEDEDFEKQRYAASVAKEILEKWDDLRRNSIAKYNNWQILPGVDQALEKTLNEIIEAVQKAKKIQEEQKMSLDDSNPEATS